MREMRTPDDVAQVNITKSKRAKCARPADWHLQLMRLPKKTHILSHIMNPLQITKTGMNLATYAINIVFNSGEIDIFAYLWNQEIRNGNNPLEKFAEYTQSSVDEIEKCHSKVLRIASKS
jgi:hypothetical protein